MYFRNYTQRFWPNPYTKIKLLIDICILQVNIFELFLLFFCRPIPPVPEVLLKQWKTMWKGTRRTYVHFFFPNKSLIIILKSIVALHFQLSFLEIFQRGIYSLAKHLKWTPVPKDKAHYLQIEMFKDKFASKSIVLLKNYRNAYSLWHTFINGYNKRHNFGLFWALKWLKCYFNIDKK
jgi:hypothetical protein